MDIYEVCKRRTVIGATRGADIGREGTTSCDIFARIDASRSQVGLSLGDKTGRTSLAGPKLT